MNRIVRAKNPPQIKGLWCSDPGTPAIGLFQDEQENAEFTLRSSKTQPPVWSILFKLAKKVALSE